MFCHESQQLLHQIHFALFHNLALQQHHKLTRTRSTDHQVAKHSFLRTQIKERIIVFVCIVTNRIAYLVADIIL